MLVMHKFDSVAEFSSAIEHGKKSDKFSGWKESSKDGRASFTGTSSWDEAQSLLSNGDKKLAKQLLERKDEISPETENFVQDLVARRERSVVGGIPNVGAYLVGNPRNMIRKKRIPTDTKIINIVYLNSICCGVRKEDMIRAGVNVLYCINEFEKRGYRVNLYVGAVTWVRSNKKDAWGYVVNVKNSGQYMNTEKLAYFIANPSIYRRHGFRMMEMENEVSFDEAYGWKLNEKDVINQLCEKVGIQNANIVTYYDIEDKELSYVGDKLSGRK